MNSNFLQTLHTCVLSKLKKYVAKNSANCHAVANVSKNLHKYPNISPAIVPLKCKKSCFFYINHF